MPNSQIKLPLLFTDVKRHFRKHKVKYHHSSRLCIITNETTKAFPQLEIKFDSQFPCATFRKMPLEKPLVSITVTAHDLDTLLNKIYCYSDYLKIHKPLLETIKAVKTA